MRCGLCRFFRFHRISPIFTLMSDYDHFRPPAHFTPLQGLTFRLLCIVSFVVCMALFAYFVLPLVEQYVSVPFSEWVGSFFD